MLSQIVYVSTRNKNCTDVEIQNILASCQKNNPLLDITGILLYSDTKFIQMVEGEYQVISGLYDKIKLDHRHDQVRMIATSPIKQKSFPSWHMGSKKISESPVDFNTPITSQEKAVFNNILNGVEDDSKKVLNILKKFF